MKTINSIILTVGLVFTVHLLHGQIAPFGISNNGFRPVQPLPDPGDSIVQLTADAQGLQLVSPDQIPLSGTFWTIAPGPDTMALPFPCPPLGYNLPTYALADGSYLVDDTATTYAVTQADLETQANAVFNLIAQVQATAANQPSLSMARVMDFELPVPVGGGTNSYGDDLVTNSPPINYGTNLWLEITNISGVWVNLLVSNTVADVKYELDGTTNLAQGNWTFEQFFYGSELTNWTPTTIPAFTLTNNLFLRVKSWASSDGSGLPDWWELEYFGCLGVNPYGDPKGDGWSNIQKFQNGMNPNTFYTPPAPQGVNVVYNPTTEEATVSWLPSPGAVSGYTVVDSDGNTNILTANTFTMVDNISSDTPDPVSGDIWTTISVQANYTNGNSAWAGPIPVEQVPVLANIIPGPSGTAFLSVSALPLYTTAVRLTEIDLYTIYFIGGNGFVTNYDIPVADFTNGMYQLKNNVIPGDGNDREGVGYIWIAQAVGSNDKGLTGTTQLVQDYSSPLDGFQNSWLVPPYFDGRIQMKQNLIFQLRAAWYDTALEFSEVYSDGLITTTYPNNYAYAGFYQNDSAYSGVFNAQLPFEDNYRYLNFAYNLGNVNSVGMLNAFYNSFTLSGDGLGLSEPPTYQFVSPTTNNAEIPALLATNSYRWIGNGFANYALPDGYGESDVSMYEIAIIPDIYATPTNIVKTGVSNVFGLPFLSDLVAWGNSSADTSIIYPGYGTTQNQYFYTEVGIPQFQGAGYEFWQEAAGDTLPGNPNFSPANSSSLIVTSLGNPIQISGYAKLAVANGYHGVYGFLGQYFQQAYEINTNGIVTTNTTGILSPYGGFFATQPGPVAMVTMPDVDSEEQGTCTVYAVSLAVDANHDGNMDLTYGGTDSTSQANPMQFWVNNNYDRLYYDQDDKTNYEDDVLPQDCPYTPGLSTPDCDYRNADGLRIIPTKRDLEDYARLWVCGVTPNLLASLPANSTVTLSWGDVGTPNTNNPTIDLFQAADPDGGIGYLTNSTIATIQTNGSQSLYVARLGPGTYVDLTGYQFSNYWAGSHFIWCGVAPGNGQLLLTIADGHGNILARASASIQIQDIKQMYERWTVGEDLNVSPTNTAIISQYDLPNPAVPGFQYAPPGNTNTPYILYVHGWNMTTYDKERFAETAFKRLYWQGYQGRFGVFQWPTGNGFVGLTTIFTNLTEKDNFDSSVYNAWQSATALLKKLTDLNQEYPGKVYMLAHSMGNVAAGEAIRLSGITNVVNTYVASQAAVSAHTYDENTNDVPDYSFYYPPWSTDPGTPNIYGNWFAGNDGGGAGHVYNFYNANDFALRRSAWQTDELLKPDQDVLEIGSDWNYDYAGSPNDPAPWNHFFKEILFGTVVDFNIVTNLNSRYEVMSYAAESYTTALGATPNVGNLSGNINLGRISNPRIWQPDPTGNNYTEHFWHSAEFRGDNTMLQDYWAEVLGPEAFNIK